MIKHMLRGGRERERRKGTGKGKGKGKGKGGGRGMGEGKGKRKGEGKSIAQVSHYIFNNRLFKCLKVISLSDLVLVQGYPQRMRLYR